MSESKQPRRSQLQIIFLTVFLYLVGFGVIIPMIPLLAKDFGASALQIGLLMSIYSGVQFLASPFWGRLSDRKGRKPILLMCLLGEGCSYILFAISRSYEVLFISRLLAGFFAGSISTAAAYISDVTPANERSKGMALIGAAFGLGFLIGPALGGVLTVWGQQFSQEKHFGTSFSAYCVAAFCFFVFLFAVKFLTESLVITDKDAIKPRQARMKLLRKYLAVPVLGPLIGVYFISSFSMAIMEATLILLMGERFHWGILEVSYGFAYIGLVSVFCQGFLVRRLLPKLGERKMLIIGLMAMGLSFLSIPFAPNLTWLAFIMTLLGVGNSFTNPSILGSISLTSQADEQGAVMGIAQSASSLGRILGPALGGFLYQRVGQNSPFLTGGVVAWVGFSIIASLYMRLPESAKKAKVA